MPDADAALPPDARLVLYDGECGFCDGMVQWLLARDPEGRFRFAPLQGRTAGALRVRHPEIPRAHDTMVLVEADARGAETVRLRSDAVLAVCAALPAPWRWLAVLRVLPTPLRDAAYAAFARLRYRVWGRLDHCRIPSGAERQRFLV